jgi:hypothetical protein
MMTMVYGVAGGAGGLFIIVGVAVAYFRRKQAKKSNPLIGTQDGTLTRLLPNSNLHVFSVFINSIGNQL